MLLAVEGFCGEHVAVVFADEIALGGVARDIFLGLAACVLPAVREVVVGVDVFQQMALLEIAYAAGLA